MKVLIYLFLLLIASSSFAQTKSHYNVNKYNVVNDGYDPISYFMGTPLLGKKEFSYDYNGVTYWFATKDNRAMFIKSPIKYEAQYGGWCAYALGLRPEKVKVDPKTYKIADGKLYLFYNFYFTNTLKSWNKDEGTLKSNADKNWELVMQ